MADTILEAARALLAAIDSGGYTPPSEEIREALRELDRAVALVAGRDDAQKIAMALKGKITSVDDVTGTVAFDFGRPGAPQPLILALRSPLFRNLVALVEKAGRAP